MKATMNGFMTIWKSYFSANRFRAFPLWVRIGLAILFLPVHIVFVGLFLNLMVLFFFIAMTRVPGDFLKDSLREAEKQHWLIQLVVFFFVYPLKFLFDFITACQYIPLALLYFLWSVFGCLGSWGGLACQPLLMYIDEKKILGLSPINPTKRRSLITGVSVWVLIAATLVYFFLVPLVSSLIRDARMDQMYEEPFVLTNEGEITVQTTRWMDTVICSFTPSETKNYLLHSTGAYDTRIVVQDAERNNIGFNEDSGVNQNFRLVIELEEGATYFFVLSVFPQGIPADFIFFLAEASAEEPTGDGHSFGKAFFISEPGVLSIEIESGEKTYYRFVPEVSGTYVIQSSGTRDTNVSLYSSSFNLLVTDDDTGPSLNFYLSRYFSAGTTYYFSFGLYGGGSGTYSVTISKSN